MKLESTFDSEYHIGHIFNLLCSKAKFWTKESYHFLTVTTDFCSNNSQLTMNMQTDVN